MAKALSSEEVTTFRARLCAAAERLFAQHGVENVGIRQLAQALGCSPMTPYRYFRDKDEIRAATRAAAFDRFAAALEALLPGAVRVWRISDTVGEGAPSLSEAYGRTRPSFYLVRPDGYVSVRGRPASDLHGLLRHCETWFAKGSAVEPGAG